MSALSVGPDVEAVDRWLGGWPKQTLALEANGTLIQALKDHVEESFEAISYKFSHQNEMYLTTSEALELFSLPLGPPGSW